MIVKLIDNSKSGSLLERVNVPGYSEHSRQTASNRGIDQNERSVVFYNYDTIPLDDDGVVYVEEDAVFMIEEELVRPGVIVTKKHFTQEDSGFTFCEQEFFVVERTSCEIPVGAVVICKPKTAYLFDVDKRFIPYGCIYLYVDDKPKAISNKSLIEIVEPELFEKQRRLRGKHDNELCFFREFETIINIKGKSYAVVNNKSIYATCDIVVSTTE